MKPAMDIIYSFLRFLGFLDEPPPLRKILKRSRVFDDFSSDDELPMLDCRQVKRFRSADKATSSNGDKDSRHSNSVKNVHLPVKDSYTTSTPNDSPKRTVPANLSEFSKHRPTTSIRKTISVKPVIDAKVLEHNEPTVGSQLENTLKKPSILHVDLDEDDSDDNQQDDDVVFVKDVITPPTSPREYFLQTKVLDAIMLDETLEYQELLRRIATPIKLVSKTKLVAESKLEDATSELDSELNADGQRNATKENVPVRVSSSDSSDSDVEVVAPESSKMSSIKQDFERKSRVWLLELYSKYKKVQDAKIEDENREARRVSDTTSRVNNDQNIARTPRADKMSTSEVLRSKLNSANNINQSHNKPETKTHEKLNDSRKTADFTPNRNNERNETTSSKPENINAWLAKLDKKYFSRPKPTENGNDMQPTKAQSSNPGIAGDWLSKLESKYKTDQLKSQEKLSGAVQVPVIVSKVNTESSPRNKWLARLEAEYFSSAQKSQQNLSNARHDSNIALKVNDEQNEVYVVETNFENVVPETRDQLDCALRESYIQKERGETNRARSYLPVTARDWLSKLDAQYKTASKNQEDLNKARQKLENISKVNGEPSEPRSTKLDSTDPDDCLAELKSRYNVVHQKTLNGVSLESDMIPKINREENEALSHRPDTTAERPSKISKLDSEQETEQPKTQTEPDNMQEEVTNLLKVNCGRNEAHSLKFNTSEDLMMQLGSLYKTGQQEKNQNISEQNRKSKGDDIDMEEQSNMDFLPALTPEQEKIVELSLEPGPEDEILVEKFNMKIHRRDMQTLADTFWLNDAVINFYMNLIMQRSQERKELPKVYATNSFFYPKLMQSGHDGLKRWTRKVDIFAYDLFLVPVNIGNHWCLSIVDFRYCVIKYLDSQRLPNLECLDALLQYLTDEHKDKKGAPFDLSDWLTECPTDIPQQMNGSDCGMFACTFAEFSSRDAAYSFTQAHMPYLRRKAALEILTGKLLL